MTWQTYPYDGWVVTSAFVVKKLTFTRASYGGGYDRPYDGGAAYNRYTEIFQTKEEAIEAANDRLDATEARIKVTQQNLVKHRAKLKKQAQGGES